MREQACLSETVDAVRWVKDCGYNSKVMTAFWGQDAK